MQALDGREEELLLRVEQAEEVRLRDAGVAGDRVGRGAVQAVLGELAAGGIEHGGAAFVGGLSDGAGSLR